MTGLRSRRVLPILASLAASSLAASALLTLAVSCRDETLDLGGEAGAAATPNDGVDGGAGPWVLFDSNRAGFTRAIYAVRAGGGGLTQLTTGSASAYEPGVTPNGLSLSYVTADAHGHLQVFVRDLSTGEISQITHRPYGAHQAAWSRDGARVAYVGISSAGVDSGILDTQGTVEVFVSDADGTNERLVGGSARDEPPSSPGFGGDPDVVFYARGNGSVRARGVDGGADRVVAYSSSFLETPCVAPDGLSLAFAVYDGDGEGLHIVDSARSLSPNEDAGPFSDASDVGSLVFPSGTFRRPAWSRDDVLAFETGLAGAPQSTIAIIAAAGGATPQVITTGAYDDRNPAWAPPDFKLSSPIAIDAPPPGQDF